MSITQGNNVPIVSVIIPIYNEENYIEDCLKSLINQDFPIENTEIILVDGGSTDKTLDIINNFIVSIDEKIGCCIKILNNAKKTVQFALNIGIKEATGHYIVRMDAHSQFSNDYISKCVEYLEKTKADNVGGTMIAIGKNDIQKVIAAAYSSKFAFGGGDFHNPNYEGFTDSVFLGAFHRDFLLEIGLYDENFPINEDDELNFRIIERGGKIFVTPKIRSKYFPRDNYLGLFKQYFKYGFWKVDVIKKHGKATRLSHFIPFFFVTFLILLPVLIFIPIIKLFAYTILLIYIALNIVFSCSNSKISGILNKLRLILVHFIMHFAYGLGFGARLFQLIFSKIKNKENSKNYI